jgi:hypothetical protein
LDAEDAPAPPPAKKPALLPAAKPAAAAKPAPAAAAAAARKPLAAVPQQQVQAAPAPAGVFRRGGIYATNRNKPIQPQCVPRVAGLRRKQ